MKSVLPQIKSNVVHNKRKNKVNGKRPAGKDEARTVSLACDLSLFRPTMLLHSGNSVSTGMH
jgi:hypothetical protein